VKQNKKLPRKQRILLKLHSWNQQPKVMNKIAINCYDSIHFIDRATEEFDLTDQQNVNTEECTFICNKGINYILYMYVYNYIKNICDLILENHSKSHITVFQEIQI